MSLDDRSTDRMSIESEVYTAGADDLERLTRIEACIAREFGAPPLLLLAAIAIPGGDGKNVRTANMSRMSNGEAMIVLGRCMEMYAAKELADMMIHKARASDIK